MKKITSILLTAGLLGGLYLALETSLKREDENYKSQKPSSVGDICINSPTGNNPSWDLLNIKPEQVSKNPYLKLIIDNNIDGKFDYTTMEGYLETIASSSTHLANTEAVRPVIHVDTNMGKVAVDCNAPYAADALTAISK